MNTKICKKLSMRFVKMTVLFCGIFFDLCIQISNNKKCNYGRKKRTNRSHYG